MLDDQDLPPSRYAPLVDAEVTSTVLNVYELDGQDWRPVYAPDGQLVEMLPGETVRDLSERIPHPGLYRVVAREPRTQKIQRRKDWSLRPIPRPGFTPQPKPGAHPDMIALYQQQVATANAERREALDELRRERDRMDNALRQERDRFSEMQSLMRDRIEETRDRASKAAVELAGMAARLEARDQRVAELEAQLEDMRAEVLRAQELASELRRKADDAEFSPLDAIMQMDQALDVIGKTAERFGKG